MGPELRISFSSPARSLNEHMCNIDAAPASAAAASTAAAEAWATSMPALPRQFVDTHMPMQLCAPAGAETHGAHTPLLHPASSLPTLTPSSMECEPLIAHRKPARLDESVH